MVTRIAAAVLITAVLAGGASAARPGIQVGVLGDPARFDAQTSQHSDFRLIIMSWGQGESPQYFSSLFATMQAVPVLGLSTGGGEGGGPEVITMGKIARGAGDGFLLALNQAIAAWGKTIYVRPMAEMNGHWNAYCAYNANGSAKGADYSTAAFRKAFARIYLAVHGGAGVNRALRTARDAAHSRRADREPPRARALEPAGLREPRSAGQLCAGVLPGRPLRGRRGRRSLRHRGPRRVARDRCALPGAPGEAVRDRSSGGSGASTTRPSSSRWRSSPRRTGGSILLGYYSGRPGSVFDLASKPRSLAAYRKLIAAL